MDGLLLIHKVLYQKIRTEENVIKSFLSIYYHTPNFKLVTYSKLKENPNFSEVNIKCSEFDKKYKRHVIRFRKHDIKS